jgi:hypothetical protein
MKVGDETTGRCPGSTLIEHANSYRNLQRVSRPGDCKSELVSIALRQPTDGLFIGCLMARCA